NLRAMQTMAATFGVRVGYSDHTLGIEVSTAAVALGARVIEKHFTLDKTSAGPDHAASLEPHELAALVAAVRNIERALGDGVKRRRPIEVDVARVARKSIVVARDVDAGAIVGPADLAMRRPGTGLPAEQLELVIGRRARRALRAGELLTHGALE
ncbi:MAG TPA: N-acetylneuraminate synthase family protein, partial [Myxococcota bacterium]